MGRHHEYPVTMDMLDSLSVLLQRVNRFRADYGQPMTVSSGYRPGKYNVAAGGAKTSAHLTCKAIDIRDPFGTLAKFLTVEKLREYDLYMENPAATKGWVHLDTVPRATRIFNP